MLSSSATLFSKKPTLPIPASALTMEFFTQADLEPLAIVARATYKETYPGFTPKELDELFGEFFRQKILNEDLPNKNCVVLLMKDAGKIIGYAKLYFGKDIPLLDKLYLLKSHHGQGLGRSLLLRCFKICSERGHNQLNLNAYKENLQAIQFYEAHGFSKQEKPVDYVNPANGQIAVGSNIEMLCNDVNKQLTYKRYQCH